MFESTWKILSCAFVQLFEGYAVENKLLCRSDMDQVLSYIEARKGL